MTPSNEPTKALPRGAGCDTCHFTGKLLKAASPMFREYGPEPCPCCYTASAPLPGVTMGGEVESRAVGTEWQRTRKAFTELTQAIADCKRHGGDGNWRVLVSAVDEMQESCQAYRDAMAGALSLATKPQSAEVREVSEEDVEVANVAWAKAYTELEDDKPPKGEIDDICMRAALVAYERGRKPAPARREGEES